MKKLVLMFIVVFSMCAVAGSAEEVLWCEYEEDDITDISSNCAGDPKPSCCMQAESVREQCIAAATGQAQQECQSQASSYCANAANSALPEECWGMMSGPCAQWWSELYSGCCSWYVYACVQDLVIFAYHYCYEIAVEAYASCVE